MTAYKLDRKHFRWSIWDYGSPGSYFITINLKDGEHHFGEVINGHMLTTLSGSIAAYYISEIPKRFIHTKVLSWVVMPNHIHLIVQVAYQIHFKKDGVWGGFSGVKNPMLFKNISTIVRWFKGRVAFECRKRGFGIEWHSRFYDRIVRNPVELRNVIRYIEDNPKNFSD